MVLPALSTLDDDLLLSILHFSTAPDLARCRAVCRSLSQQADVDALWERHCLDESLQRNGSARPTSRTYCSWRQTWLDSRCEGCGRTYMVKINLDGGSSSASTWHGAKVPLCKACALRSLFCYRTSASDGVAESMLPRLARRYAPLGQFVVRICGRNMDGMVKELGLVREYEQFVEGEKRLTDLFASGARRSSQQMM